ncbi:glycosyltransferase [Microbacterium sp. GXF0217]
MTAGHPSGTIVMAAYQPDPELFRRQLQSLRAQSVQDWTCVISVDGDRSPVAALVEEITGGDERFLVIGDDRRRGFYGNFEQALEAVPADAAWVALADQDDHWYPHKLATLLALLDDCSLVSGQARLVTYPDGVELGVTDRADHGAASTVLINQFTGSLCVFERALLEDALPFPHPPSRVATHDHWLAVVAGARRGTAIVNEIVQDYVQHDANVYGDPSRAGDTGLLAPLRNALRLAERVEGSRSPLAVVRMTFWTYVGWRQLMVDALAARRGPDAISASLAGGFGRGRSYRKLNAQLAISVAQGVISSRYAWGYRASWLAGALIGGRRRVDAAVAKVSPARTP